MTITDKTLPAGYQVRPVTIADLSTVVALRNASSQDTRGTNITADHWQMRQWLEANINLARDTQSRFIKTKDGVSHVISYFRRRTSPNKEVSGLASA